MVTDGEDHILTLSSEGMIVTVGPGNPAYGLSFIPFLEFDWPIIK